MTIGDVVRLNSGSQKMLVVDILPATARDLIVVAWLNEKNKPEEMILSKACFRKE